MKRFVVHAAKIPERFQNLTKAQRDMLGAHYVNACNDKEWKARPDGLYQPWEGVACETCKLIVAHQPRGAAGATR